MRGIVTILLTLLAVSASGQLVVHPIGHSAMDHHEDISFQRSTQYNADRLDTLQLPFWDDFSQTNRTPDTTRWYIGANVHVNASLALNPPTLNIATLDGADAFGFPYNLSASSPQPTDLLESHAIDLSSYSDADQVVFSFYWQAGGKADKPESIDKLELRFLNNEEPPQWDSVWAVTGNSEQISTEFQLQTIAIVDPKYLHEGFQFQFESTGNAVGAFDAWHIDYIYLNRDRTLSGESIDDHAVSLPPTSIFSTYTAIPMSQLEAFGDTIFDYPSFALSSFESSIYTVDYTYNLVQIDNPGINDDSRSVIYSYTPTNRLPLSGINDQVTYIVPGSDLDVGGIVVPELNADIFNLALDSIHLISEVIFRTNDGQIPLTNNSADGITFLNDDEYNFRINDTVRHFFEINEVLAYDDGTAELSAGLDRRGGQIAVRFELAVADSLTGIDIYFPRIGTLPQNRRFKLSIYNDLSDENPLITDEFSRVDSLQAINVFQRFEYTRAQLLTGAFFVVFEQFSEDYFPIGLDADRPNEDKIFINLGGTWTKATQDDLTVDGSLMIRPRFGRLISKPTNVSQRVISDLHVYPNPASNTLFLSRPADHLRLTNLSGQTVAYGSGDSIDISSLPRGLYLLHLIVRDQESVHKILIQH